MRKNILRFLWHVILAMAVTGAVGACGPVKSTAIILEADTSLHNAKTAGGDQKSPYEYTAAEQYLHKAREKWGTSDFEYAVDYATLARDMADKARDKGMAQEE